MTNRKALVKGTIKISFIVAVLVALGFLVFNYVLPVFAAHTSTATVSPGVVQASTDYTFTVTISNDGGSSDPISEVRIYHDSAPLSNPNDFTNYACYPKTGWNGPFNITGSEGTYCLYTAQTTDDRIAPGESTDFTFSATSPETESCRNLHFESRDPQQFWLPLYDDVCVDADPPVTTKSFDGPQKIDENGVEWIDGVTQIVLNPIDPEPHPSGADKTWYINILDESEDSCWNPNYDCQSSCGSPYEQYEGAGECINSVQEWCDQNWQLYGDSWKLCVEDFVYGECQISCNGQKWQLYDGTPIQKEEESCHILQFFSVDNIGNVENVNDNCFFVDKTPPILDKEVGQPSVPGDGFDLVSPYTNITFTCTDQQPHPSDDEELCFFVSFDKEPFDLTSNYCSNYDGGTMGEDGFCCVPVGEDVGPLCSGGGCPDDNDNQFVFNFNENEDSTHDLEYYCKDAVEKRTDTFLQWYKVDTESPVITKEMFGSWLGNCPPDPEPSNDGCYVADDGSSGVSISVQDVGHAAEFGAECRYELWWEGQLIQSDYFSESTDIYFNEDSTHVLKIWCSDALGNPVYDEEEFLVDSTPPVTKKTYGDPYVQDWFPKGCYDQYVEQCEGQPECIAEFCDWAEWINSSTPISLSAEDEKVGVDTTYWRNLLITEPEAAWYICGFPQYYCNPQFYMPYVENPDEPLNEWTGEPFNKKEESCHVIEYYSIDKLGNQEDLKWQCAFVDNSYPDVTKEIGEPKVVKTTCEQPGNDNSNDNSNGNGNFNSNDNSNPCDSTTQPEQCAYLDSSDLPPFVRDTIISEGGDPDSLDASCGKVVVLSSGNPTDADDTISTDMGNVGCGPNPDGFATNDCVILEDFIPDADSVVLAVSSEWQEYQFTTFTDWMQIFSDIVSVDISINDWDGTNVIPYGPANSGTQTLATIGADSSASLRVADSGDYVYDTALIVVPKGCFEEVGPPIFCGDGIVQPVLGEECDDGNTVNGDGCSSTCELEEEVCKDQTYITTKTPVTISCWDIEPHPVDHVSLWYRYRVSEDCQDWDEWTDWIDPNGYVVEKTIYFPEDSCHELEYYCEDGLGNVGPTQTEIDIVDTQPPLITKIIDGPSVGDCNPADTNPNDGECIIDGVTEINVEATDPEPHPVNDVTCQWGYWFDDDFFGWYQEGSSWSIIFPEDSTHGLVIECQDALGNFVEDSETFLVDKTPPETSKWYEGPQYENGAEWISTDTDVVLEASDEKSGVKETYWRNTLVADENCWDQELCQEAQGSGEWNLYTDPFNKEEQSCHLIEYYSVDNVDKTEEVKKQCVFVDNTAPITTKEIIGPQYEEDGKLYIDGVTEIKLTCEDQQPHPSGVDNIQYRYRVDDGEWTDWFVYEDQFNFPEESKHELEYYCNDTVGNEETHKFEIDYVDKTPPETTKTYVGYDEEPRWITTDTLIRLDAEDEKSGVKETYWRNTLVDDYYCLYQESCEQADGEEDFQLYTEPFQKSEESCHLIEYYSVDNVDKREDVKRQCIFVDNNPPSVNKTVGDPRTECSEGDWCDWKVTIMTPIELNCTDTHVIGEQEVCHRIFLDGELQDDWTCGEAPQTIHFPEESNHTLEVYCKDALQTGPVDSENFKVEGTSFEITLKKKWNLISVPFVLWDSNITKVLGNASENISAIWTYDGASDQWFVYTPDDGPDSLTDLIPGWGYWVLAKNNTKILIAGSLFSPATTPPSRELVDGWNLIGYYGTDWQEYSEDPDCGGDDQFWRYSYCSLGSLVDTQQGYPRWSSLWTYTSCTGDNAWKGLNACTTDSSINRMVAGYGYWIEMDVNDMYAPATVCYEQSNCQYWPGPYG